MESLTLQQVDLQFVRRGSGPPLLLLHGGDGPQSQLPYFQQLATHCEVIAPTHPGFGGSAVPEHFDSLEDLVYLYLDFLDALELQDITLLGCGLGGWIAAEIAVRNSNRLARLVLVDAVGIKPGDRDTRDIADVFGMAAADVMKLTFHDPTKAPNPATMTDEQLNVLAAERIAYAFYTWEPYMHNPKLPQRLHRIHIPTLLLWGASDRIVTVAYGAAYRQMIPGARLTVIAEAGHLPQVEQPEDFVQHVLAFVAP